MSDLRARAVEWYEGREARASRLDVTVTLLQRMERVIANPHTRAGLLSEVQVALRRAQRDAYAAGLRDGATRGDERSADK